MGAKKTVSIIHEPAKRVPTPKARPAKKAVKAKKTGTKNSVLVSANAALQKSNTRLEISNKKITRKGIKETASLSRSIQSGKDLTLKLAQSVERGSKNAKTAKAKLSRHIQSGKDLTLKLAQSVERGSKNAKTAKAKITQHIQSGRDLTLKLAQSVERGSKNAKTAKAKLNRRDAELIRLNKELLTFTYISSHDLQEPLRNLQILSSIILEKEEQNLSPQGKDYFARMQAAAKRIQNLIQDLIEYYNTNKLSFKLELTDLDKILADVKKELKETLSENNVKIRSSNLNAITIVPFQFCKLFKELICNAIKFAQKDSDPEIIIKSEIIRGAEIKTPGLHARKRYCHISFSDNGLGFDLLFKERIFEVFQKLHGRKYKGSGIGLATCRKIVENHGGTITATSEPGKGSTFNIYIPL